MALILFTFAFDPETKVLTYAGNIAPAEVALPMAVQILQEALVGEALQRASKAEESLRSQKRKEPKPK